MRSSFTLKSVSSTQDIAKSNLNTSTSKHLWSFSKDSRFKKPLVYCDTIYNIPSPMKRKGTGIGYGKKSDFTVDLTCSPSASRYKLDSVFDKNRTSRKGFSIYQSRSKIPSRGHIPLQPLKVPGPSAYNNMKPKSRSPSFSMRKKMQVIDVTMSIQAQNKNPAPGRYQNPQALSPTGKYIVSKNNGSGSNTFSPKRSVRFFGFKNNNPGPGNYQAANVMKDNGKYQLASTLGYGQRLFDKEKRQNAFDYKARKNYNPGPGSYRAPSDFGHYDGNVYKNTGGIAYMARSTNIKLQSLNASVRSSRSKL